MPDNPASPESNTRIFDPAQYFLGPPDRIKTLEQPSDIIHHISSYDSSIGVTRLAINNLKAKRRAERSVRVDRDSVIVVVDAVVKDGRRAGYGVWFGKNSTSNISSVIPDNKPQTKELALLLGTGFALKAAYELLFLVSPSSSSVTPTNEKRGTKKVVIVTDSQYLVKCMSDWVWVWQKQGFINDREEWVNNHVEIRGLGDVCLDLERVGGEVRFWLVEKGGVEDARRLAEAVLDENGDRNEK